LEWWKDPDEIIKAGWDFENFIKNALSPIWFYIKVSNFDTTSLDDKKKLLWELLIVLKSYSDDIEKDFYIKEISHRLDIPQNLIYNELNKISIKKEASEKFESPVYTSEDYALAYIYLKDDYKRIFNENLFFKEDLTNNLQKALLEENFLDNFDLIKKESIRWLSLEIEQNLGLETEDKIANDIKKLCLEINKRTSKKIGDALKRELEIDKNNLDALIKYNDFIKKLRDLKIKL